MLYAPRTILVESISEGLLLPAMAALVLADEEALARFSGASIIFADGVGFRPYLKILLKPESTGGIAIADRVALITDADGNAGVPQRVTDAVSDVAKWGTAAHLEAFISHPTLEPELWHADNVETLRIAFLACAPNSAGRFADIAAAADPATRFGELFVVKGKRADGTPGIEISKAQFAHALADRLSPKCGFVVPGYLASAIRYIASPSEIGGC